jgi:hypothetical protein
MEPAFDVDSLRVASPCPKAWDDMVGDDRVRFCDQCSLRVYNLSELTPAETQNLISSAGGKLCGRLFRRADGTVLTKDCPVGLRAFRKRISRRAGAAFATVLGLSTTIFAQHPSGKDKDSCQPQIRVTKTQRAANDKALLSGTVTDQFGAVIPLATVVLENMKTKETTSVSATDAGQFAFAALTEGTYSLTVKLHPFKSLVVTDVKVEADKVLNMDVTLELSGGEVVGLLLSGPSLLDTPPGTMIMSGDTLRRLPLRP